VTGRLRVGVIGGGSMGFNHARVLAEMEDVELVGVADPSAEARARVGRRLRAHTFADYRELIQRARPHAVTVVVPTTLHYRVAADAIESGCHVLVEKPIASNCDEGADLIVRAADRGVALSVGHVERFNPAVRELKRRIDAGDLGTIFQVHARRVGPFPARIRDVGVIVDLATHDLDVMRFLLDSTVERVYAETAQRIHADHEDLLSGLIRFTNGAIGVLDVNWLTPTKIRELSVTGERGMFVVNYLTQDLLFFHNDWAQRTWYPGGGQPTVSEGDSIKIRLDRHEALAAELEAFVKAVRGEAPLLVTGWDGLEALRLAEAVRQSGRERRAITLASPAPVALTTAKDAP
jgi:UDP-N-acetylglucosamine 3-dehydrogenase